MQRRLWIGRRRMPVFLVARACSRLYRTRSALCTPYSRLPLSCCSFLLRVWYGSLFALFVLCLPIYVVKSVKFRSYCDDVCLLCNYGEDIHIFVLFPFALYRLRMFAGSCCCRVCLVSFFDLPRSPFSSVMVPKSSKTLFCRVILFAVASLLLISRIFQPYSQNRPFCMWDASGR